jgi:hypothetical protein
LAVESARRRFFEGNGAPEPILEVAAESKRDSGFMSWPNRKKNEVRQPEAVDKVKREEEKKEPAKKEEKKEEKPPEKKPVEKQKEKEKEKDKTLVSKGSFRARFSRTPKSPKSQKRTEKSKSDKDLSKSGDAKKSEEKSKDSKGKGKQEKKVETKEKSEEKKEEKGKSKTAVTKPGKPILFGSVRDKTKWFLQRTKSTELETPKEPAPSTSARKWSIPENGSKVSSGSATTSSSGSGSGKSQQANGNQERSVGFVSLE